MKHRFDSALSKLNYKNTKFSSVEISMGKAVVVIAYFVINNSKLDMIMMLNKTPFKDKYIITKIKQQNISIMGAIYKNLMKLHETSRNII